MNQAINLMSFFDTEIKNSIYNKLYEKVCNKPELNDTQAERVWYLTRQQISFIKQKLSKLPKQLRIKICKQDIRYFTAYYLDEYLFDHQIEWFEFFESYQNKCLLAPRGHGKSECLMYARIIYKIVYNRNINILLVSRAKGLASKRVKAIREQLMFNKKLISDFGSFLTHRKGTKQTITRRQDQFKVLGSKGAYPTLEAMGYWSVKTGNRYDDINCDDIVERNDGATETQFLKIREEFFGNFMKLIKDKRKSMINLVGTKKRRNDLYSEIEKDPTFAVRHYQAVNKGYEYFKDRSSYEVLYKTDKRTGFKIAYDIKIKNPERFEVLWSNLWDVKALILEWLSDPVQFDRELQNDVSSSDVIQFLDEWLDRAKKEELNFAENSIDIDRNKYLYVVQGWDLSAVSGVDRAEKNNTDYTVCLTVGVDSDWRLTILNMYRRRGLRFDEFKEAVVTQNERYEPDVVVMEANGFQDWGVQEFVKTSGINIQPHITTALNKRSIKFGLNLLVNKFASDKVEIPYPTNPIYIKDRLKAESIINEFKFFGRVGQKKDIVMTLWIVAFYITHYAMTMGAKEYSLKGTDYEKLYGN